MIVVSYQLCENGCVEAHFQVLFNVMLDLLSLTY